MRDLARDSNRSGGEGCRLRTDAGRHDCAGRLRSKRARLPWKRTVAGRRVRPEPSGADPRTGTGTEPIGEGRADSSSVFDARGCAAEPRQRGGDDGRRPDTQSPRGQPPRRRWKPGGRRRSEAVRTSPVAGIEVVPAAGRRCAGPASPPARSGAFGACGRRFSRQFVRLYQLIRFPTVIWLGLISVTRTGMSAKIVASAIPVAAMAIPEYSRPRSSPLSALAVPVRLSGRPCRV